MNVSTHPITSHRFELSGASVAGRQTSATRAHPARPLVEALVESYVYRPRNLFPRSDLPEDNQQHFVFGPISAAVFRPACDAAEPPVIQTECLVRPNSPGTRVRARFRFLQPAAREIGVLGQSTDSGETPAHCLVPYFVIHGRNYCAWHEAAERTLELDLSLDQGSGPTTASFHFPGGRTVEPIRGADGRVRGVDGHIPGAVIWRQEDVEGRITLSHEDLGNRCRRLTLRTEFSNPAAEGRRLMGEPMLLHTLASAHAHLSVERGQFLPLTTPPDEWTRAADACRNIAAWPVLIGDETWGDSDSMLSSAVVLPDFPEPDPEGDEGAPSTEVPTVRILAMTDEERRAVQDAYELAR